MKKMFIQMALVGVAGIGDVFLLSYVIQVMDKSHWAHAPAFICLGMALFGLLALGSYISVYGPIDIKDQESK